MGTPVISTGNLNSKVKEHPITRGWFLGHFVKDDEFLHNEEFELKWAVYEKGYVHHGAVHPSTAKTIVVLIKGSYSMNFPHLDDPVVLREVGDYVAYDAYEVHNEGTALDDCTLLFIRWPSRNKYAIK
jgi:hypothetical protein